ncbi:Putative outer membrane core complex of type IVb secretion [Succinivibrio dextrinosolvens]|uniref:DotH/IcmK family type IV secretion protein n=1 Tax=Succinivibrio dextrinosolvens TaxID=83771 RepID=UPI0008E2488C|nr:DotH/IcmK family type IV secretion protein [Succinivibrio dextrinosolvens]SFS34129.1 Putative outer membrane core complex of type IVb secretion [Succinivibrio dextrinosolvens]
MQLLRCMYICGMLLLPFCAEAITMPAPPPELSDTLTKFRTKEQINESVNLSNGSSAVVEEIEVESAPFVPGDINAGIMRLSENYSPLMTIGVPAYGSSIVRFYDLNGIPWDIASVECENQGYLTEITASPSELLIKQNVGATTTKLKVSLSRYDYPLVFNLSPVRLERDGVAVSTLVNTVKIKSATNSYGYVYPSIRQVPKPNPDAKMVKFDSTDLQKIEVTLLDAVRALDHE